LLRANSRSLLRLKPCREDNLMMRPALAYDGHSMYLDWALANDHRPLISWH
jgi:hypothetical protein